MAPRKGDPLKYRAIAGGVYDAIMLSPHEETGFVNLTVYCKPDRSDSMDLHRVTFTEGPTTKRATAWAAPREGK